MAESLALGCYPMMSGKFLHLGHHLKLTATWGFLEMAGGRVHTSSSALSYLALNACGLSKT